VAVRAEGIEVSEQAVLIDSAYRNHSCHPREGGEPVRRGSSVLSLTSNTGSSAFADDDSAICDRVLAARRTRGLHLRLLPLEAPRAQGRPGARCTRGPVCNCAQKNAHTSIQVQRKHSGLPCAVALRLIASSPRRTALLPPSSPRSLLLENLTPAPRRQDHTTSPYVSCAYVSHIPRPPHPTARS
jgi:hypothetical protein